MDLNGMIPSLAQADILMNALLIDCFVSSVTKLCALWYSIDWKKLPSNSVF